MKLWEGFPKYASCYSKSKKNNYLKSLKYFEQFLKYNNYNIFTNLKCFFTFYSGLINKNYLSNSQKNSLKLSSFLINDNLNKELKKKYF